MEMFGSFLSWSFNSERMMLVRSSVDNKVPLNTLGSLPPLVCTRIARCVNFSDAIFTPIGVCGANAKLTILVFDCESMSH